MAWWGMTVVVPAGREASDSEHRFARTMALRGVEGREKEKEGWREKSRKRR